MTSGIQERQNAPENIKLLSAQRAFYRRAKRTAGAQVLLAVLTPLAGALLVAFKTEYDAWAALIGIAAALIDTGWLDPLQSSLRRCGANVQEEFDHAVLLTTCNVVLRGPCTVEEEIFEASRSIQVADLEKLRNWYPARASEVPLPIGRLVCQRTNLWWDSKLRMRYKNLIYGFAAVLVVAIIGYALYKAQPVSKMVLNAALVLPALQWILREGRRQKDGATDLDRLREYADGLWLRVLENAIADDVVTAHSNELQSTILVGRRDRPVVFEFIYNLLRSKQEDQMNENANSMVDSYERSRS